MNWFETFCSWIVPFCVVLFLTLLPILIYQIASGKVQLSKDSHYDYYLPSAPSHPGFPGPL